MSDLGGAGGFAGVTMASHTSYVYSAISLSRYFRAARDASPVMCVIVTFHACAKSCGTGINII